MILIKSIDVVNVEEDDFIEISHFLRNDYECIPIGSKLRQERCAGIEIEMIEGMRYVNNKCEIVVIGMSKQVQEAIGLPMEVFKDLTDTNYMQSSTIRKQDVEIRLMKSLLDKFRNMNFWNRIKFIFNFKNINREE